MENRHLNARMSGKVLYSCQQCDHKMAHKCTMKGTNMQFIIESDLKGVLSVTTGHMQHRTLKGTWVQFTLSGDLISV